ncbi:hypothetical protein BKI52_42510 [marine bacterium AO1-C]|nr:hypothetical protein BKI52_42510 [marine bacterium AO1-C]
MNNIRLILLILFVSLSSLGLGQQFLYTPKNDSIKATFQEFLQEMINSKADPSVQLDINTRFKIVFKTHCGEYEFPPNLPGKVDSLLHRPAKRLKFLKLAPKKLLQTLRRHNCSDTRITTITWRGIFGYKELMRKNGSMVSWGNLFLVYNINNKYLILYEKNSVPVSRLGDVGYYTASFAKVVE